jgi:hypothetical protein
LRYLSIGQFLPGLQLLLQKEIGLGLSSAGGDRSGLVDCASSGGLTKLDRVSNPPLNVRDGGLNSAAHKLML